MTEPPRLRPRPQARPAVHPGQAAAFGRPQDVPGSFARVDQRRTDARMRTAAPPDPKLTEAFSRPPGAPHSLQRGAQEPTPTAPGFNATATDADPWREVTSSARLGPPALSAEAEADPADRPPAEKLGVRELLLGSRVRPTALVFLVVLALAVGAVGGLIGRGTAAVNTALTSPDVTLAQAKDTAVPPTGVASIAAAVLPSVVSVQVRAGDTLATGSGVVIDGGGYIVTNNHVISLAATKPSGSTLDVAFSDGSRERAQIVGRDTKTDLAVLRAPVKNPTVAQLGSSAKLNVGDAVVAIGSPLGLAGTVTTGIISAKQRPVSLSGDGSDTDAVIDALQTDAAINPGNSGGPLVDAQGHVIGIPVDEVTQVAQEIIRTGAAHHPTIGINVRSVTDGSTDGASVGNVVAGGAAAKAGVAEGDVITKVGARSIAGAEELTVAIQEQAIGTPVPLQVVRAGHTVDIQVTPQSD